MKWAICGLYALVTAALFFGYALKVNSSHSLPHWLYLAKPAKDIAITKIVTFQLPQSKATFCKVVAGLPGDYFSISEGMVYINGIPQGEKGASSKIPYTCTGFIPEGYFFALGCSADSFDSRYSLFGLVPLKAIKEQLCPIY